MEKRFPSDIPTNNSKPKVSQQNFQTEPLSEKPKKTRQKSENND
jgi:hypothetical protein